MQLLLTKDEYDRLQEKASKNTTLEVLCDTQNSNIKYLKSMLFKMGRNLRKNVKEFKCPVPNGTYIRSKIDEDDQEYCNIGSFSGRGGRMIYDCPIYAFADKKKIDYKILCGNKNCGEHCFK